MINPKDQRITKTVEIFEEMNLFTRDEITWMEDYLSGAAGEEGLERLAFRDLSGVSQDLATKMRTLLLEFSNKGRNEELEKVSRILFAVGQSTSAGLFPVQNYYYFDKSNILASDPAKKIAIYAVGVGMNEYQMNRYSLQNIAKMAGNDPEIVRQAIGYQRNQLENAKVILMTAYFLLKYPKVNPEEGRGKGWQEGFLAGVGRLFGQGGGETSRLEEQDAPLMKEFENLLVNSLHNLYGGQMAQTEMNEIVSAVNQDKVDARILKMAGAKFQVKRFMLSILGGPAFVHYALSGRLRNVLMICLAADTENMLNIMVNYDLRNEFQKRGGDFDERFGIDSRKYIAWAASKSQVSILEEQFKRNRELYIQYMQNADFDTFNLMNAIVKREDPEFYQERMGQDAFRQQSKVTEAFVSLVDAQFENTVRSYLNGETGIESLYACGAGLSIRGGRWGGRYWSILQSYQKGYGHDALSRRCEALLMAARGFNYYGYVVEGGKLQAKKVEELFSGVNSEGLNLKCQLNAYSDLHDAFYTDKWKNEFQSVARGIFRKYLAQRREEMTSAIQETGSTGRHFGLTLLAESPEENKEEILRFSQDTSKLVREEFLSVLYKEKGWEADILGFLTSKKAADREVGIRVLSEWDAEKYKENLTEALGREKNAKVRALLETALHVSGGEEADGKADGKAITREDLVKDLHKGNKKRSLAWAYETPFSKVHKKDGQEAGEDYLQAICLSYAAMSPCGVSPSAATLAKDLDEKELAVYVNELFDKWLEQGAESKKRWVLYAASIHGGDDIVKKLQHQIQEWPQAARGAIASEAVQALSLSPQPQALLIVDGISRKFKFKQVKAAAGKALEFAASQLGITTEELADRIVPDMGFDENMERQFDYGERRFTVTITTALEIEVFDESGKKLKNLPAPGKRDDEAKAQAAYEEFKQMKKQMKATVSSQKMRLEMALSTGRQWSIEAWKNLFVKNPVMHQFAIGLIWGVYENRKLISSFRYMEDGSFNTEDEDEFELPETAAEGQPAGSAPCIGLVHPLELSEESKKAWKEQLEDYEIAQPIEQLDRPVYYRTKEEGDQKSLERFGGCILNDLSLAGKLQALGWYRGSVQDGGGFYSYYREDPELGLGVELHFSGSYVGGGNEDVTVYEARFYNAGGTTLAENGGVMAGGIKRGSYVYDEANDSNSYFLKDIPERYFSEIVLQLTKATASSKEKNENWKAQK